MFSCIISMMREGFLLRFIVTTAFTATYILARSRLTCKAVHDVPLFFIETFPSLFFLLYSSLLHPSVIAPMHRVHWLVNAMVTLQKCSLLFTLATIFITMHLKTLIISDDVSFMKLYVNIFILRYLYFIKNNIYFL